MLDRCPNSYCRDELNVHETEYEVEYYCLGGCSFYRVDKKLIPGKPLQSKDFVYEKREKKKKKPRY